MALGFAQGVRLLLLATTALMPFSLSAQELPSGGTVSSGSATISAPANGALSITQTSDRASINWNSFSVGEGGSVSFSQPADTSAVLNRVTGSDPSRIFGQIDANGRVFVVNPRGVVVGAEGRVNAGAFVASSLDISDEDFQSGRLSFSGNGASASVENAGRITTAAGGYVALLGGQVSNSGTIIAPLGRVGLASGERVTLDLGGDGFLQVAVPTDTAEGRALIENAGRIEAEGGLVEMRAATAADAVRNAINLSGVVEARSVSGRNGAIVLGGGLGGRVAVSGRASTAPVTFTAPEVSPTPEPRPARIDVSGAEIALAGAEIDASGLVDGGVVRIGGDHLGQGDFQRARTLDVDADTVIRTNAGAEGTGGDVTLWSGFGTLYLGQIEAKGGAVSGDGGFVEVSSVEGLFYGGVVDTSSVSGAYGTTLIDPGDVYIVEPGFTPDADPEDSILTTDAVEATLAGSDLTVTTTTVAGCCGDIRVLGDLSYDFGRLTLEAENDIRIEGSIIASTPLTFGGSLTLRSLNGGTVATTANADIVVGQFDLEGTANFSQIFSTLPVFSALDFEIGENASFLRATGGDGDIAPYVIEDVYGLQGIGSTALLSSNFRLADDIDAGGTSRWGLRVGPQDPDTGIVEITYEGFVPIGSRPGDVDLAFTGSLDGNGTTIRDIVVTPTSGDAGFFWSIQGSVTDLAFANATVSGETAGGVAASNSGLISGVNFAGSVNGSLDNDGRIWVGGLVGFNLGQLIDSNVTGSVTSDALIVSIGGAVGSQTDPFEGEEILISNVTSDATVEATGVGVFVDSYIGGLAGTNGSAIDSSFSSGAVTVTGENIVAGGFAGLNFGTIANSRTISGVDVNSSVFATTGGFVGSNTGTVEDSRSDGSIFVRNTSGDSLIPIGGFAGSTTGTLSRVATTSSIDAVVSDELVLGGLAGEAGGRIEDSYTTGMIVRAEAGSSLSAVGGFVGEVLSGARFDSSFSAVSAETVNIPDGSRIGGVFGAFDFGAAEVIVDPETYFDSTLWTLNSGLLGTPLPTSTLQSTDAFQEQATTWDFASVWAPGGEGRYPGLYTIDPVIYVRPDTNARFLYKDDSAGDREVSFQSSGGPGVYVFSEDDIPFDAEKQLRATYGVIVDDPDIPDNPFDLEARVKRGSEGEVLPYELEVGSLTFGDEFGVVRDSAGQIYDWVADNGQMFIDPRPALIVRTFDREKNYADPSFTEGMIYTEPGASTVAGLQAGDGATVFLRSDGTAPEANVLPDGAGYPIFVDSIEILNEAGLDATDSYGPANSPVRYVELTPRGEMIVVPIPLTIELATVLKQVGEEYQFDGTEFVQPTGLPNGDFVLEVLGLTSGGAPAEADIGSYAIGADSAQLIRGDGDEDVSGNYIISFTPGEMRVGGLILISNAGGDKLYGDEFEFDTDALEFLNVSEDLGPLTYEVTLSSDGAPATADVVSEGYEIVVTGFRVLDADGVEIPSDLILGAEVVADDRLVVIPRTLLIVAPDDEKYFSQEPVDLGAPTILTTSGIEGDEGEPYELPNGDALVIGPGDIASAGNTRDADAGQYLVDIGGIDIFRGDQDVSGNYSVGYVRGDFIVLPQPITVAAIDQRRILQQPFTLGQNVTYSTVEGLELPENVEDLVGDIVLVSDGTAEDAPVAVYPIGIETPLFSENPNYDFEFQTGDLLVLAGETVITPVVIPVPPTDGTPAEIGTRELVEELLDATLSVAAGGGSTSEAELAAAEQTLGEVTVAGGGVQTAVASCRREAASPEAVLACVAQALEDFSGEIDDLSSGLPAELASVSSVLGGLSNNIRAIQQTATIRLDAATSEAERNAIRQDAIAQSRAALRSAAAEIQQAIGLIRADDPELASIQIETGGVIVDALFTLDTEFARAVEL